MTQPYPQKTQQHTGLKLPQPAISPLINYLIDPFVTWIPMTWLPQNIRRDTALGALHEIDNIRPRPFPVSGLDRFKFFTKKSGEFLRNGLQQVSVSYGVGWSLTISTKRAVGYGTKAPPLAGHIPPKSIYIWPLRNLIVSRRNFPKTSDMTELGDPNTKLVY